MGSICEKTGMSQSMTSSHLDQMQRSGLLESRRFGKWTYYRRNEETISALVRFVADDLWRTSAFLRKCIDN